MALLSPTRFSAGLTVLGALALTALAAAAPRPAARPAKLPAPAQPAPVRDPAAFFESKVRPVLAEHCFSCHAERVQTGGLRLDSRAAMLKGGKRGPSVVPGNSAKSILLHAVRHEGGLAMPPGGKLKPAEIAALEQWVKMGAPWPEAAAGSGGLWSLAPLQRPAVPKVKNAAWVRNPVDAFVLAELEQRGWKPNGYADRRTLIRRVSLDLTGIPPTPEEVDQFVADRSPDAYEKVVDRLLASKHYGERMALHWLDLARYADSDGYHDDTDRAMWGWRDYVIQAFNQNKRFDQFTIEQLAGDQLPTPTLEQKIASAFNRLGPTSSEGGAIPEEYLAKYAVDRVNTTGSVWLGLTIQCAECHDHKYDPISAKDFYRFFAFFNQVPEQVLYRGADAPPVLAVPLPEQTAQLAEYDRQIAALEAAAKMRADAPDAKAEEGRVAEVNKKLKAVRHNRTELDRLTKLRIMADLPERRPTHILLRGDYRTPGEAVLPGVPAALGALPEGKVASRLDLARWLVSRENPLTPRVTVNRFWQMIFGTGLAKSTDDFGARGEKPSHPQLLDWLAMEFREGPVGGGVPWDVKRLLRLIVTSATYQQSSAFTPQTVARDPANRYLARGPRFRLQAELIRDNALAVSGLLDRNRAVGGISIKPYQPGDLWRELSAGDQEAKGYVQDHGPNLYRRGLYVFWKRSILYPSLAVFDAPKREVCSLQRPITNTPLQAFATLNDVTYVEAARVFAQRVLEQGGATAESRLTYAFRQALARPPSAAERKVLTRLHQSTLAHYTQHKEAALKLLTVGESPRSDKLDPAEHAAWMCVCNAILNLDETITKE